jgi:acyl-coenzyme A thioesterase PaaI-like protein
MGLIRRETTMTTTTASPFLSDTVEPRCVDAPAARCAYRRFGATGEPRLVMRTRFRRALNGGRRIAFAEAHTRDQGGELVGHATTSLAINRP